MLQKALRDCIIIHQDHCIPDESLIPRIQDHPDWERPEAIDWVKLEQKIIRARSGGKPVIVEGLMAFSKREINRYYDKCIFIELSKTRFIDRKQTDLRWGKEPDWYINHIWESYKTYGLPPSDMENLLTISGESDFILSDILSFLNTGNAV